MNTNHAAYLLTATLSLAAFATIGCAEKDKTTGTTTPSADSLSDTMHSATAATSALAASTWSNIKDTTYDGRDAFAAGVASMQSELDRQIATLANKRASMASSTNTTDWDLAMKELEIARTALKSSGDELSQATADTWSQAKEKVGQAWVRTQDAIAKVKASTTS